jgi:hypothetical protein
LTGIATAAAAPQTETEPWTTERGRPTNGYRPAVPSQTEQGWRHGSQRGWAMLIGAALIVFLTLSAGIGVWMANGDPEPAVIPAATVPMDQRVTLSNVRIEPLVEQLVPAGSIPENEVNLVATVKYVLEPGEAWRDEPSPCELAPMMSTGLVVSGTASMVTTGPFELFRSSGQSETIPAGAKGVMQAGDHWVYFSDSEETDTGYRNPGTVPLTVIESGWAYGSSCEQVPPNPEWLWAKSGYVGDFDPSRPVIVTIERATVQPGVMLSAEEVERIGFDPNEADIFRTIAVESGTLHESSAPPESSPSAGDDGRVFGPGDVWNPVLSRSPPEGVERTFASAGSEPLVLTIVSYAYEDEEQTRPKLEEID